MTLMMIIVYTLLVVSMSCNGKATQLSDHNIAKRQSVSPSTTPCNSSNEGQSLYKVVHADHNLIWICKSKEWTPYELSPLNAISCKQIKQQLTNDCNVSEKNGLYWLKGVDECTQSSYVPILVYCDMSELDGGGWTLVWQHSYMEDLPLNLSMRYFSKDYTPCITRASGWCNIPNKARFNPTEQMIVAYHKGTVVYAYKGLFNRNIGHNWSGAILLDFKKIKDNCTNAKDFQPAPQNGLVIGLTFDKASPYNYKINTDTYHGSFTNPRDCRWENCHLPSSISSSDKHVQMTVAIYVR